MAVEGIGLPFEDGLVVITSDGGVVAVDAAGRRLWEALQAGCTEDDLIGASVEHGGLPIEVARANVASALKSWRALGLIDGPGRGAEAMPVETPAVGRPPGRTPALDAVYLVGDLPVRVRCDGVALGAVIDAACSACRVEDATDALAHVDVIAQEHGLAVRADGALLARAEAVTPNRALARHRCLTALLEMARPSRQWLAILHASAVGIDGRCVVFPGAKGSSKSTLAAALVAAGADFVTDDYAPLEQASWHVWPVPYAPAIKHGSWRTLREHYPDLDAQPVHQLADLRIRYLNLHASRIAPLSPGLPVAALIFPRFDADSGVEQRRITATEAFAALCHASSMLNRRPEILAETLRWVETIPAYQLVYGDLEQAIEWILSLRLE